MIRLAVLSAALAFAQAPDTSESLPGAPPAKDAVCLRPWSPEITKIYGLSAQAFAERCRKPPVRPAVGRGPSERAQAPAADLGALQSAVSGGDVAALYGEKTFGTPPAGAVAAPPFQAKGPAAAEKPDVRGIRFGPIPDLELEKVPKCGAARGLSGRPDAGQKLYSYVESAAACSPVYGASLSHMLTITGLRNYGSSDVGGTNSGLSRFFSALAFQDEGYRRRLQDFYGQIERFDRLNYTVRFAGDDRDAKANINEAAGAGRSAGIEPGWAWKLALKTAAGDANEAMRLIGYCGHDDVLQGTLAAPVSREAAQAGLEAERERLMSAASRASLIRRDAGYADRLSRDVNGLDAKNFAARYDDLCPDKASIFYLPQSLDRSADIPPGLKKKVERIRSEAGQADKAKYYHVYSGAVIACELIRKGMPAGLARTVESHAATGYRTLWLYQEARKLDEMRAALSAEYGRLAAQGIEKRTEEEYLRAKAGEKLPEMDAVLFLKRWRYFKGPLPTDWSLSPLALVGRYIKPAGWSQERFDAAVKRADAYLIDFEWTEEQHEAGSRFAAKVCRQE